MYKVLLVDDEMLDLEGLERLIPWESLGMHVVSAVNSGFEALDYLQSNPVDVLVSDIKMPIMSGLELAGRALELIPRLKMVFISGYEDFQYAKKAIQLNAAGYILKPVDDHEVIRVLTEVKNELKREAQMEKLERGFNNSVHQVNDERLIHWLSGDGGEELPLLKNTLKELNSHGPYQIGLLELDDVSLKLERLPDNKKQSHISETYNALNTCCEIEGIAIFCRAEGHRFVLVLYGDSRLEKLRRILEYVENHSPLTVTAGLGQITDNIQELPVSFRSAKEMLSYKIFCGKNRVIVWEDIESFQLIDVLDIDEILQKLFAAIANYELVKVDDSLEQLYGNVKQLGKRMSVYNVTIHLIAKLDSFLFNMNENLRTILGIDVNHLDVLYDFETVNDIKSWLRRKLFEISEMLQLKKLRKNHKLIEGIEEYVNKHLDRNLTLRDVANYFSFSPNYLGHLFKEEKDENFSDFVIRKRLEKASELLEDPKLKIYEVADRVGYKSLTYFSRQFREKFGATPGDYRKKR
ncbi:response regulator [Cohnella sp.]|uniref:response regulator n=1 Tax=Cohnella sp. TaxID=1883426 RepID=UPI00356A02DB